MHKLFVTIVVVLLFASLSIAAAPSADPRTPGLVGPGIRYRLAGALAVSSKTHTIFFVLNDAAGHAVVSEKFTGQVPKGLTDPTFTLLRDEDALAEATARATSLIVTVDGQLVDTMPLKELLSRASDLKAIDSSSSPFLNARPKGPGTSSSLKALPTAGVAIQKLHPHQEDTWAGCNQEDYCYAQYYYCIDNCSPWDPYNPCEACSSNLSACQGGVEIDAWSETTLISSTYDGLWKCDPTQVATVGKTYQEYAEYTHHQEFQYWRCIDENGEAHYTTVTTVDTYYTTYCYHLIDPYSCNSGLGAYINCFL